MLQVGIVVAQPLAILYYGTYHIYNKCSNEEYGIRLNIVLGILVVNDDAIGGEQDDGNSRKGNGNERTLAVLQHTYQYRHYQGHKGNPVEHDAHNVTN